MTTKKKITKKATDERVEKRIVAACNYVSRMGFEIVRSNYTTDSDGSSKCGVCAIAALLIKNGQRKGAETRPNKSTLRRRFLKIHTSANDFGYEGPGVADVAARILGIDETDCQLFMRGFDGKKSDTNRYVQMGRRLSRRFVKSVSKK